MGDSPEWEVGVNMGNKAILFRRGLFVLFMRPIHSFKLGLHKGRYRSLSEYGRSGGVDLWHDLPVMQKLQRIKCKVDPTTHEMSFIDPKTNQTIHSRDRGVSVGLGLIPFINSTATVPLKISPGKEL